MKVQTKHEFPPIQGAEAKIELVDWYIAPAIRKHRSRKAYRNDQLDWILRTKRTKEEVEILHQAKLTGVKCPKVLFVDPASNEIIMEYIQGTLLKDLLEAGSGLFRILGRYGAFLHLAGIIHGDLTTKNVIVTEGDLCLIDFGLSFFSDRVEDRAEDLHLLKQALKSSDSSGNAASRFDSVLEGYGDIAGIESVLAIKRQIGKIELRGRYAQVD